MDEQQMSLIRQFETGAKDRAEQERAATAKAEAALAPLEARARALREQQRAAHRAEGLRAAADFYAQLLADAGDAVHGDPRYWTAVRDIALGLRRRADDETQPPAGVQTTRHAARRDAFARVIYERWNPGHQWANAHPDDVIAYGVDADHAMAAADSVAGITYAPPTRTDTYREVADRLTALGTRPDCGWATTAAGKVRAWADEERDEQEAQAHLDQLADELPGLPVGFRTAVVIAVKCAVCDYEFDEGQSYTVHFDTVDQAGQVLKDHGWTVLADGRAVCDSDEDDHHELRGTTSPAKAREDSDREYHQAEINAAIDYALNEMP